VASLASMMTEILAEEGDVSTGGALKRAIGQKMRNFRKSMEMQNIVHSMTGSDLLGVMTARALGRGPQSMRRMRFGRDEWGNPIKSSSAGGRKDALSPNSDYYDVQSTRGGAARGGAPDTPTNKILRRIYSEVQHTNILQKAQLGEMMKADYFDSLTREHDKVTEENQQDQTQKFDDLIRILERGHGGGQGHGAGIDDILKGYHPGTGGVLGNLATGAEIMAGAEAGGWILGGLGLIFPALGFLASWGIPIAAAGDLMYHFFEDYSKTKDAKKSWTNALRGTTTDILKVLGFSPKTINDKLNYGDMAAKYNMPNPDKAYGDVYTNGITYKSAAERAKAVDDLKKKYQHDLDVVDSMTPAERNPSVTRGINPQIYRAGKSPGQSIPTPPGVTTLPGYGTPGTYPPPGSNIDSLNLQRLPAAGSAPPKSTVTPLSGNTDIPPEGKALLNSIAVGESKGAYDVIVGGTKFNSYAEHPGIIDPALYKKTGFNSDAAGKYQFLSTTWKWIKDRLKLADFSPENQDKAAWFLAQSDYQKRTGKNLLSSLKQGDTIGVANALSPTWTSLPGGSQPNSATNAFQANYAAAIPTAPNQLAAVYHQSQATNDQIKGTPAPTAPVIISNKIDQSRKQSITNNMSGGADPWNPENTSRPDLG